MDQVSIVKKQFCTEQWKQRILECQASGMTVRNWCKQQGVVEQTYYRYLKILRQELCDSLTVPVQETSKTVQIRSVSKNLFLWEGDGFVLLYKRL